MRRALALLSVMCLGTVSWAADNGVYLGAGISQASVDVDVRAPGVPRIDDDNTKFKIIAGIRPLDWFALEVNYVDFGSFDNTVGTNRASYELKGIDAFAVGLFEVGLVDLFAKAGVIRWDQELRLSSTLLSSPPLPSTSADDTGFDPAFGAGIQLHFGSLGARLEFETFEVDDADASLVTLALTWTFL